jgi:hypothetical protein
MLIRVRVQLVWLVGTGSLALQTSIGFLSWSKKHKRAIQILEASSFQRSRHHCKLLHSFSDKCTSPAHLAASLNGSWLPVPVGAPWAPIQSALSGGLTDFASLTAKSKSPTCELALAFLSVKPRCLFPLAKPLERVRCRSKTLSTTLKRR